MAEVHSLDHQRCPGEAIEEPPSFAQFCAAFSPDKVNDFASSCGRFRASAFGNLVNQLPPQECTIPLDSGEGPIIISLESEPPNESFHSFQHYPKWTKLAWFLHQWIHKWQFVVLFPLLGSMSIFFALRHHALWEYFLRIYIFHLCLLWMSVIFPVYPFPGAQLSDLYLTVVMNAMLLYDPFFFYVCSGNFLWLVLTIRLRPYVFSNNKRMKLTVLTVMALVSPWAFFIMLPAALLFLLVLPVTAAAFSVQNPTYMVCILSKVFPCLPIHKIKQMELDASEKEHELEEENQTKVDRQIAQLGRPNPRTRASEEPDHRVANIMLGLLGLCYLGFLVWYSDWLTSIEMAEVVKRLPSPVAKARQLAGMANVFGSRPSGRPS